MYILEKKHFKSCSNGNFFLIKKYIDFRKIQENINFLKKMAMQVFWETDFL